MTRLTRLMTIALLLLSLGITGCMPQRQPEKGQEKEKQGEKQGGKKDEKKDEKAENPVVEGADKVQTELKELEAALRTGNAAEVTRQARKVDDAWERLEPKVANTNHELHTRIERSLNIVLATVQVVPFDIGIIGAEIDRLNQKLEELKETKGKAPKVEQVDMKTGAPAMRQALADLRTVVGTGDTARMQEKARSVDQIWNQFRDEAKEREKQRYEEIENNLHTLMREVTNTPVNATKVGEQITKLDVQLSALAE